VDIEKLTKEEEDEEKFVAEKVEKGGKDKKKEKGGKKDKDN